MADSFVPDGSSRSYRSTCRTHATPERLAAAITWLLSDDSRVGSGVLLG